MIYWPSVRCALILTCHWISSSLVSKAKSTTRSLQMMAIVWLSFSRVNPVSMARKPSKERDDLVLAFLHRSLLSRYICKWRQSVNQLMKINLNNCHSFKHKNILSREPIDRINEKMTEKSISYRKTGNVCELLFHSIIITWNQGTEWMVFPKNSNSMHLIDSIDGNWFYLWSHKWLVITINYRNNLFDICLKAIL